MIKSVRSVPRSQLRCRSIRPILSIQKKSHYNSARHSNLKPLPNSDLKINQRTDSEQNTDSSEEKNEKLIPKEINDIEYEPVADENIPMDFLQNISGMRSSRSGGFNMVSFDTQVNPALLSLPPLPKLNSPEFSEAFEKKIELCNYICDFYNPQLDTVAKIDKKKTLEEIFNIVSKVELLYKLQNDQIAQILTMCKNNIIRDLPVLNAHLIFSEDLPPISEPSWPHLNIIYQIMFSIFQQCNRHPVFTNQFILDLLPMMQSPDPVERQVLDRFIIEYLKSREGKLATQNYINSVFFPTLSRLLTTHIESKTPPFIVGPILQIYLHIFQCTRQDKNSTQQVYNQILRLLSDYHLSTFEDQFYSIIDFFSDESSAFASMLARALITHWPKSCAEKEASFVRMMIDVMPKISSRDLAPLVPRIFSLLAECVSSQSLKVAEQSFHIWTSHKIEPIISEHSKKIFFLTYELVLKGAREHWSRSIRINLVTVLQLLQKISPRIINNTVNINNKNISPYKLSDQKMKNTSPIKPKNQQDEIMKFINDEKQVKKKEGVAKWAEIARMAAKRDKRINLGKKLSEITMLFNGTLKTVILTQVKK
ncbi:hypothetical protein M9Y10_035399 [Tritrichomonas musculus]|uniref:Phosphoprotein phosphatase n=1 Tax=Tritrichomonas musculus TaxID=1915356 RepID=A0ABR2KHJ3_9EUKA